MKKPPAIFLMGPTASGKTDLALWLSQQMPCEIISVDSALIYRGMDIGTAKPSAEELAACPHHLINILDPAESYSAARFRHDALKLMQDITDRGRIPVLVGGTMMYFKVLLHGMSEVPNASPDIRREILARADQFGWPWLHKELWKVDSESARRINPNDPQRLQRALEVWHSTGITMTEWREREKTHKQPFPYQALQMAMAPPDRRILHQRIEKRFHAMLAAGFENEVRQLYQRGDLNAGMPSIRAVGYRQMWSWLEGDVDFPTMRDKGIAATRQLAKRQLTWLRSWPDLNWLEYGTMNEPMPEAMIEQMRQHSLQLVNQHIKPID